MKPVDPYMVAIYWQQMRKVQNKYFKTKASKVSLQARCEFEERLDRTAKMLPKTDPFRKQIQKARVFQKKYFNSADHSLLKECKDVERRVDAMAKDIVERMTETPSLFADHEEAA